MQCGIDPRQSSVSSYSFMYRRSSSPLFGRLSMSALTRLLQVWFELNGEPKRNLRQYPYPFFVSPATIDQVLDLKFCGYSSTDPPGTYRAIPRYVLGAALLILAIIPTLTQSIEMYKMSRRWQTTRPMKLLVREGAVYFIVYVSLVSLCHFYVSIVRPLSTIHVPLRKPTESN